jgi:hypothetical protein
MTFFALSQTNFAGLSGWFEVLDRQKTFVDLSKGDRQRLLVYVGFDKRSYVFQKTLAQLRVIGIDLSGTFGRIEDEAVFRAALVKKFVNRWIGNAVH